MASETQAVILARALKLAAMDVGVRLAAQMTMVTIATFVGYDGRTTVVKLAMLTAPTEGEMMTVS